MNIEKLNQLCAYLHAKNQLNAQRRRAQMRGYSLQEGLRYAMWQERQALLQKDGAGYTWQEVQTLMRCIPSYEKVSTDDFFEMQIRYPESRYVFKNEDAFVRLSEANNRFPPNKKHSSLSRKEICLRLKKNTIERLNAEMAIQKFTKQHRKEMAKLRKELNVRVTVDAGNYYTSVYRVKGDILPDREVILHCKKQIEAGAVADCLERMLAE